MVFPLPRIEKVQDVLRAMGHIIEYVGKGEVTPNEGAAISGLLAEVRNALEGTEIERRLAELEARAQGTR